MNYLHFEKFKNHAVIRWVSAYVIRLLVLIYKYVLHVYMYSLSNNKLFSLFNLLNLWWQFITLDGGKFSKCGNHIILTLSAGDKGANEYQNNIISVIKIVKAKEERRKGRVLKKIIDSIFSVLQR